MKDIRRAFQVSVLTEERQLRRLAGALCLFSDYVRVGMSESRCVSYGPRNNLIVVTQSVNCTEQLTRF